MLILRKRRLQNGFHQSDCYFQVKPKALTLATLKPGQKDVSRCAVPSKAQLGFAKLHSRGQINISCQDRLRDSLVIQLKLDLCNLIGF